MAKQLNVLITGANRGIGLALARAYLDRGDRVAATCRQPAKAGGLHALKETFRDDLLIPRVDVNLGRSVAAAAEYVEEHFPRLDVLVNNAGISPGRAQDGLEALEMTQVRDAFETNAIGPLRTTRAFLPLLRKSKTPRVVNVSSGIGSLSRKPPERDHFYAYAASKAALNMFTRVSAAEFRAQGICIVAVTPGWVRTDMGGAEAQLDPAPVAEELVAAIDTLTMEHTSLWLDRHGKVSDFAW